MSIVVVVVLASSVYRNKPQAAGRRQQSNERTGIERDGRGRVGLYREGTTVDVGKSRRGGPADRRLPRTNRQHASHEADDRQPQSERDPSGSGRRSGS